MVLGRLFTRCPLDDPREKAWTELRMQWLSEQFGLDALLQAEVLVPTRDCFPEPFGGTIEDAEGFVRRLCGQYRMDASRIVLAIDAPHELPDAAGMYSEDEQGTTTIRLAQDQFENPEQLIATLAHELSHRRLLGERRMTGQEPDMEYVTDLLPVFFGAGVFNANATITDVSGMDGSWSFWRMRRLGYLPSRIYGYALGLFAWLRGETAPRWAGNLRRDARDVLHAALRYLAKSEDSVFAAGTAGRPMEPPSTGRLVEQLQTGTPSRRVFAMWGLQDRPTQAAEAIPGVLQLTRDKAPMIAATALETLATISPPGAEIESQIRPLLTHAHPSVRSMAILAVQKLCPRVEEAAQDFVVSLRDSHPTVVCWALHALSECGPAAAIAERELLSVLKRAIVGHHRLTAELCLGALRAFIDDEEAARRELRAAFPDPEIHTQAIDLLRELNESGERPQPPDAFNLGSRPGTARLH